MQENAKTGLEKVLEITLKTAKEKPLQYRNPELCKKTGETIDFAGLGLAPCQESEESQLYTIRKRTWGVGQTIIVNHYLNLEGQKGSFDNKSPDELDALVAEAIKNSSVYETVEVWQYQESSEPTALEKAFGQQPAVKKQWQEKTTIYAYHGTVEVDGKKPEKEYNPLKIAGIVSDVIKRMQEST